MVRSENKTLRKERKSSYEGRFGVFMYIRACSVSYTDTLSEFPKKEKKTEECYHMLRPAG